MFGNNIKLLRNRLKKTQAQVADELGMQRPTLSGYENGVSEPNLESLMKLSEYYKMSIETLAKTDLSRISDAAIQQQQAGNDMYVSGRQMRILVTTVDSKNNENIELVNHKARAGYAVGFSDPEFISELPIFQLPFLDRQKKYRTFEIEGDSMLPIPEGSKITAEQIQDWDTLKNDTPCIIVTKNEDEGIVFKIVENHLKTKHLLRLKSLNPKYKPYDIFPENIHEVWKFVHYISEEIPNPIGSNDLILTELFRLQRDITDIKKQVVPKQLSLEL